MLKDPDSRPHEGHLVDATLSHPRATSAVFDDPNLVSAAGLVPVLRVGRGRAGLPDLADEQLRVPTDKGANAGLKVASLVAGMVAGADSIDDMALLRHGGMGRVFDRRVRALDAGVVPAGVHLRPRPPARRGRLPVPDRAGRADAAAADRRPTSRVMVDVDDTIIEVHGHAKQGAGFGYSGVRGLNALLATVTTGSAAPVIVAQRLRKGSCGSPRGAKRLVARRGARPPAARPARPGGPGAGGLGVLRPRHVHAAVRAGAARLGHGADGPAVKAAIAAIADDAWTTIEYTDASSTKPPGRGSPAPRSPRSRSPRSLAGRRPSRCPAGWSCAGSPTSTRPTNAGQATPVRHCGASTRSSPPPPRPCDTVAADKTHRRHAIIEQVHADLKNSALAHLPSGQVHRQRRLAGAGRDRVQPHPRRRHPHRTPQLAKATTATIRRKLITVPARIASSARRITLHLPEAWPWEHAWTALFDQSLRTTRPGHQLTTRRDGPTKDHGEPDNQVGR